MIRVIHIADLHLGGNSPEKAAASIDFLIEQMNDKSAPAHGADLVCVTGDTTEKPLHVHSDHLKPLLKLIALAPQIPMIFLQGTPSHEPYGFLANLKETSGESFFLMDTPAVLHPYLPMCDPIEFVGCRIAALPSLSRVMLDKWTTAKWEAPFETPEENIRELLEDIGAKWKDFKGPKILLGHFTVNGCTTGTGQTLYGSDISVGLDDLALSGADAVLLGHIHASQEWSTPLFVSYCGSSYNCNWGELDQKSFSVLEFDEETGKIVSFQRVPFPHKPMVKVSVIFTGEQRDDGVWICQCKTAEDQAALVMIEGNPNVEAKVCYEVTKEFAPQIDDPYVRVHFYRSMGIDLAAVERTIQSSTRERIANIGEIETTRAQYESVCSCKGEEPRPGALEKADILDESGVMA